MAMGATASMLWWPVPVIEGLVDGGYRNPVRSRHGSPTTKPPGNILRSGRSGRRLMAILMPMASVKHLVGMSLGGYPAQINSLRHPNVLSLTLIASEPFGISYEAEGIGDDFMAHFGTMAR